MVMVEVEGEGEVDGDGDGYGQEGGDSRMMQEAIDKYMVGSCGVSTVS